MARVRLVRIAHARSGDKGDTANVGLSALKPELYPILVQQVTAERVQKHFAGICFGKVGKRFSNVYRTDFICYPKNTATEVDEAFILLQTLLRVLC